jgi:hypothetical protein
MPKKIYPFKIGNKYLFRTVSYFALGQIERVEGDFVVLSQASWVVDTGRFTQALKDGALSEVEISGECYVNIASIVDVFPWKHELPTKQQ